MKGVSRQVHLEHICSTLQWITLVCGHPWSLTNVHILNPVHALMQYNEDAQTQMVCQSCFIMHDRTWYTVVLWRVGTCFLSFKIDLVNTDGQSPHMKGYVGSAFTEVSTFHCLAYNFYDYVQSTNQLTTDSEDFKNEWVAKADKNRLRLKLSSFYITSMPWTICFWQLYTSMANSEHGRTRHVICNS